MHLEERVRVINGKEVIFMAKSNVFIKLHVRHKRVVMQTQWLHHGGMAYRYPSEQELMEFRSLIRLYFGQIIRDQLVLVEDRSIGNHDPFITD